MCMHVFAWLSFGGNLSRVFTYMCLVPPHPHGRGGHGGGFFCPSACGMEVLPGPLLYLWWLAPCVVMWAGELRSVGRLVGRSVGRSLGQSVALSVGRSVDRSVGRSVFGLVGRSVGRSLGQLAGRSFDRSVGRLVGRSVCRSVGRPTRSVGRHLSGDSPSSPLCCGVAPLASRSSSRGSLPLIGHGGWEALARPSLSVAWRFCLVLGADHHTQGGDVMSWDPGLVCQVPVIGLGRSGVALGGVCGAFMFLWFESGWWRPGADYTLHVVWRALLMVGHPNLPHPDGRMDGLMDRQTHACRHTHTHSRMHSRTHARMHTCAHARTHACTNACTHARMRTHDGTHTHTHACTHTCTHTHRLARMNACMHSHASAHARMHACMHACTRTRKRTRKGTSTHVCKHALAHALTHTVSY